MRSCCLVLQVQGGASGCAARWPMSLTVLLLEEALYFTADTLPSYSDLSTMQRRVVALMESLALQGIQLKVPGTPSSM